MKTLVIFLPSLFKMPSFKIFLCSSLPVEMILQCDRLELEGPGLKAQSEGLWLLSGVDEPRRGRAQSCWRHTKRCPSSWWGGRENGLTKAELYFRYMTALKFLSEKYVSASRALKYCYPS